MKKLTFFLALLLILSLSVTASATHWEIPEDAYAIWFMPEQHFTNYVYTAQTWREWQPIIDEEQSALIHNWTTARVISDHCDSEGVDGIWNMSNIRLGDVAYLITRDGRFKYECYLTAIVIPNSWGYTVGGKPIEPTSSTDIACRCCVGKDASRNYFAVFRFVKEIK